MVNINGYLQEFNNNTLAAIKELRAKIWEEYQNSPTKPLAINSKILHDMEELLYDMIIPS